MGYKDPEKDRAWSEAHRDEIRAWNRASHARNREKIAARRKAFAASHPGYRSAYMRAYRIHQSTGCSIEDARAWLSRDRTCWLCGELGATELDHDHISGFIRGWSHGNCNRAEGMVLHSPDPRTLLYTLLLSYP